MHLTSDQTAGMVYLKALIWSSYFFGDVFFSVDTGNEFLIPQDSPSCCFTVKCAPNWGDLFTIHAYLGCLCVGVVQLASIKLQFLQVFHNFCISKLVFFLGN